MTIKLSTEINKEVETAIDINIKGEDQHTECVVSQI